MKKSLLIAVILAGYSFHVAAQDKIYGGPKLAPNFSIFTEKAGNLKSGIGYSIGYFEVLELSYKVNLQAEINYTNYSFVDKQTFGSITSKTVTNNRTIELPIMAKYRVSNDFAIGVGYQFSFKPKSTAKTETTDQPTETVDQPGVKTSGVFIDANYKKGKNIFGVRILSTNDPLADPFKSINASFYVGFGIF